MNTLVLSNQTMFAMLQITTIILCVCVCVHAESVCLHVCVCVCVCLCTFLADAAQLFAREQEDVLRAAVALDGAGPLQQPAHPLEHTLQALVYVHPNLFLHTQTRFFQANYQTIHNEKHADTK